ncbi:MAG: serine/threonine-protein kinase [Betaproteobacteria bacterium]|nr:serine/threonine-protein kinase [Betaproteobacteria bacterium]
MNDIAPEQPTNDNDCTRIISTSDAPGDGDMMSVPMLPGDIQEEMDSNVPVLPMGTRLGEFEITALIGQGGFGVVYEARDHALERTVAIKEYLPVSLSTRQRDGTLRPLLRCQRETFELGMNSFINEARLLAQFDHPSLLKVYRFWQERGTAYMVMPYYRGPTLRQALDTMPGRADESLLLSIIEDLTQAIAVMHRANCYHRDIAPDNILLLEGSGRPVLLDFGAARRVIINTTQDITAILKPGYAPIEQYAKTPDTPQGAWTDIYALAAVLHIAITGYKPPPSIERVLTDSYMPLATNAQLQRRFGTQLLAAIDAGLAVRPEARPQSVAAFRKLLGLDEDATVTAQRTEQVSSFASGKNIAPAPGDKKNTLRATMATVLALLALAAGLAWWMWRGEESPVAEALPPHLLPVEGSAPGQADDAPQPPPRTPAESLAALAHGATSGFVVKAIPHKQDVRVGQDELSFEIRSSRAGYVYVYLLSSNGELLLLFPNLLDGHNRIFPNQPLTLPRAAWPLEAAGPPGVNRFAVLVSEHERDFSNSGLRSIDVFSEFSLPVLSALEAVRGSDPTPLLGKPVCPQDTPCQNIYGVSMFEIVER